MPQFLTSVVRTDFANVFTAVQTMPINGLIVGTTQLVASGGFIGVGTATPVCLITASSAASSDPRGIMSAQYSADSNGARFQLRKARGTEASPVVVQTADTLGKVRFSGWDGSNYLQMASIDVIATGTIAGTRVPTYMAFSTATNATPSVLTERMRIDDGGSLTLVSGATRNAFINGGNATLTGSDNVGIGAYLSGTLGALTSGGFNTAVGGRNGAGPGKLITTGSNNSLFGSGAGNALTTANSNTGIGYLAMFNAQTAASNTVLGELVGRDLSTGSFNIVIGAGWTGSTGVTTGSNNILVGKDVRPPSQTNSDQLNIGNLIYATGLGSGATISTGKVGIGTVAPLEKSDIFGGNLVLSANSSTTPRRQFMVTPSFVVSTDASFTTRGIMAAFDAASPTTGRECIRVESSGSAAMCGFFGAAAVVKPAGTGETVGFTAGGGTAVTDASTFTGNVGSTAYHLSDVVKALKNLGLMAA